MFCKQAVNLGGVAANFHPPTEPTDAFAALRAKDVRTGIKIPCPYVDVCEFLPPRLTGYRDTKSKDSKKVSDAERGSTGDVDEATVSLCFCIRSALEILLLSDYGNRMANEWT